jgi:CopG-like RHH_1 or ribbon-helix-helix domain, RHH_5
MRMPNDFEANPMGRFSINLPDILDEDLQQWAEEESRPKANLAALLIELAIRQKYPEKYPPRKTVKTTELPLD